MKRGTPDHWKMKDLARRLKVPPIYAIAWANGVMERIWHYAAKYCPQGDIGRVPDEEIAEVCGWPAKSAGRLVEALTQARWLDRSPTHRLLIHDWHEHCDQSVKKTLQNRGLDFFFPEKSGMVPEKNSLPLPLPKPLPEPLPFPTARERSLETSQPPPQEIRKQKVAEILTEKLSERQAESELDAKLTVEELESAWENHHKHTRNEPKNLALSRVVALMLDLDFDVGRFRTRHAKFCAYWDKHDWRYCPLSFLGWIEAGMPEPPPEVQKNERMAVLDESLNAWAKGAEA